MNKGVQILLCPCNASMNLIMQQSAITSCTSARNWNESPQTYPVLSSDRPLKAKWWS